MVPVPPPMLGSLPQPSTEVYNWIYTMPGSTRILLRSLALLMAKWYRKPTGHFTTVDNFSIVGRESKNFARTTKEVILIRVNDPSLNRNIGNVPTTTHMG